MAIPVKIVMECPKCGYAKVVTRGDCLPNESIFQKCPKCGTLMVDSDKRPEDVEGVLDKIVNVIKKL